jgi:uncharacterized damage-inducible protein DinB
MNAGVSFDALFAYAQEESRKWEQWFKQNPDAFNVKVDVADVGNARGMLHHIFWVEQLYVSRMLKEPTPTPDQNPREPDSALFDVGKKARERLREIVAQKNDSALDQTVTFMTRLSGEVTASYRKCITHALLHSVRHWAQLATALRQAGFKQSWPHDFLQSSAMK